MMERLNNLEMGWSIRWRADRYFFPEVELGLHQKLADAETKIAALEAALARQSTTNDDDLKVQADQLNELRTENAFLVEQLTGIQAKNADMDALLATAEAERDQLKADKNGLIEQFTIAQAQIEKLNASKTALADQLASAQVGLEQAQRHVDQLNADNRRVSEQQSEAQAKIDSLTNDNRQLVEQTAKAKAKVNDLNGNNSQLSEQLADAQAEINSLTTNNHQLAEQLAEGQAKVNDLSTNNSHLAEQLVAERAQLTEAQTEVAELKARLAEAQAETEELTRKLAAQRQSNQPDNLETINGIGPTFAKRLKAAGITTFAQVAQADPEDIRKIVKARSMQKDGPELWVEQAKVLAGL